MSIQISENKDLSEHSTFGITGTAKEFICITKKEDIKKVAKYIQHSGRRVRPVGEGTNTVLTGNTVDRCLLHVDTSGLDIQKSPGAVTLKIAAGENWDDVVALAAENGWSGITALSAIPGSAGAAPVQNIGAYGRELADVIAAVQVYDFQTEAIQTLKKPACNFGYRDSMFKKQSGRFVVLSISITLEKGEPIIPDYGSVQDELENRGLEQPTHQQLRETITDIRWDKLPKPKDTPNVGSFFANPIIYQEHHQKLAKRFPDIPGYRQGGGRKVPAGWLIDKVGMKGRWRGSVGVSDKHALVLVSEESATYADLANLIGEIKQKVRDAFGITLEREPRLLF